MPLRSVAGLPARRSRSSWRAAARALPSSSARGPSLKVCGDFLSREAQELLTYLGVDIAALGARRASRPCGSQRASGHADRPCRSPPLACRGCASTRRCWPPRRRQAPRSFAARRRARSSPRQTGCGCASAPRRSRADCAALATGKHNLRGWPRARRPDRPPTRSSSRDPCGAESRSKTSCSSSATAAATSAPATSKDGAVTICWLIDASAACARSAPTGRAARPTSRADVLGARRSAGRRALSLRAPGRGLRPSPSAICAAPRLRRTSIALGRPARRHPFVHRRRHVAGARLRDRGGARAVLAGRSAQRIPAAFLARVRAQFLWARAVEATFRSAPLRAFGVSAVPSPRDVGLIANHDARHAASGTYAEPQRSSAQ